MTTFIVSIIAFFFGAALGGHIMGRTAYDDGVNDEKQRWYIHARHYGLNQEDYIHND